MKQFMKAIKNDVDQRIKNITYQRDVENRIIVPMTVNDDDDFLSVYSISGTPIISNDVADFIENSTNSLSPNEPLTLQIHSNCIDEQEKVVYRQAIKEYYLLKYAVNEKDLKRNKWIAILLMAFGIFVLAFDIYFAYQNIIWSEVIDIVAWVLLWEAADISLFENRMRKRKRLHYLSYISMKVEYVETPCD